MTCIGYQVHSRSIFQRLRGIDACCFSFLSSKISSAEVIPVFLSPHVANHTDCRTQTLKPQANRTYLQKARTSFRAKYGFVSIVYRSQAPHHRPTGSSRAFRRHLRSSLLVVYPAPAPAPQGQKKNCRQKYQLPMKRMEA